MSDGVGAVGEVEVDGGFGWRVGGDSKVGVGGEVVVLVEAERLPVVRGVTTTVEGKAIVGR
jgi:hypothetical protein